MQTVEFMLSLLLVFPGEEAIRRPCFGQHGVDARTITQFAGVGTSITRGGVAMMSGASLDPGPTCV